MGNGGLASNALKDLTGAPCELEKLKAKDKERIWDHLVYCNKHRYIMVAGSKGAGEIVNKRGIASGHAYTVKGVHVLNKERVLELRNPWGSGKEWNGRWGDNDRRNWTGALRRRHHPNGPRNDGRFFMPYEDFLEYFRQLYTCYYEDDYMLSSFKDELESEYIGCWSASLTIPGDYYVILSQEDRRGFYNPNFPTGRIG